MYQHISRPGAADAKHHLSVSIRLPTYLPSYLARVERGMRVKSLEPNRGETEEKKRERESKMEERQEGGRVGEISLSNIL